MNSKGIKENGEKMEKNKSKEYGHLLTIKKYSHNFFFFPFFGSPLFFIFFILNFLLLSQTKKKKKMWEENVQKQAVLFLGQILKGLFDSSFKTTEIFFL